MLFSSQYYVQLNPSQQRNTLRADQAEIQILTWWTASSAAATLYYSLYVQASRSLRRLTPPLWHSSLSCSGRPHAHLQRSRSHRYHRFRHPGPRSDAGQAAAQRGLLRHPQPPRARQDGGRVQSLWQHVWTHARHVPGNIRCACLCV